MMPPSGGVIFVFYFNRLLLTVYSSQSLGWRAALAGRFSLFDNRGDFMLLVILILQAFMMLMLLIILGGKV
jgi:hypothetical protein